MFTLLAASHRVFDDGTAYLTQLTPEEYTASIDCLSGSTIGQHTRHWIEFFQCLFWQLRDGNELICYDSRKRDLLLETNPEFALKAIFSLTDLMGSINADKALSLQTKIGHETITCPTSSGREWWYAIEHAIHHLAIVKIGLIQYHPQVELPAGFGLAYSTAEHCTTEGGNDLMGS